MRAGPLGMRLVPSLLGAPISHQEEEGNEKVNRAAGNRHPSGRHLDIGLSAQICQPLSMSQQPEWMKIRMNRDVDKELLPLLGIDPVGNLFI